MTEESSTASVDRVQRGLLRAAAVCGAVLLLALVALLLPVIGAGLYLLFSFVSEVIADLR